MVLKFATPMTFTCPLAKRQTKHFESRFLCVSLYEFGWIVLTVKEKRNYNEAQVCRARLSQLEADLAEFEQRYDLPSAEFYRLFQSGQTDDRMDYVEWASLVQMRDNLTQRLRLLR